MGTIRVLPAGLVNKIAAGEVIERPASVLKELVENSLDAGATRIDVAVEGGGKGLVRVSDNGAGMDGDDLALAVQPHATSKLDDESDLYALETMGFRGEALPSIASVCQMRILTRPAACDQGFALDVAGGEIGPVRPAAASPGTVVEVRNLFFNTPARRKFLKADATEVSHLTEAFARVALAHTHVHFRMSLGGKLAYDLPATDRLAQRVGDLFGGELADCLLPVELSPADDQSPAIRGLIGPPQQARASSRWQYVFLNGRFIRDRNIQHAIREAYRGLIQPDRQPVVFLHLLIRPDLVDVNVHPTKIEVRFADSNRVHSAVLRCLRDRLTRTDATAAAQAVPVEPADADEQARQQRVREAMAQYFCRLEPTQRRMVFEPTARPGTGPSPSSEPATDAGPNATREPLFEPGRPAPSSSEARASDGRLSPQDARPPVAPGDSADLGGPAAAPPSTPPTVQVHNTYLVSQTDDGLIIVDQHALHERILYETLWARLSEPGGNLPSQRMLIPQRVALGPRQAGLLLEHEELLGRLGIELTRFGPDELAVCAFPALLDRLDPGSFVRDLADRLADEPPAGPEDFLHHTLDMMACKAAVKAGQPLTGPEIEALLAGRHLVERSGRCPHGRPTTLKFSLADLERQFKRR